MMGYPTLVVVHLFVVVVVAVLSFGGAEQTEPVEGQVVPVPEFSSDVWNKVVDVILDYSKREMKKRGGDSQELRDLNHRIDKKFGFLKLRGNFTAEGGWVYDVTSARRLGDVETKRVGTTFKISANLTWDDLGLGYRHYRLDLGRVIEGDFEVKIMSNKIKVVFSFDLVDGECVTKMDNLKILDMSDLRVKITGLGFLNFLAQHLANWFVESRRDDLTSKIEKAFLEGVPEHLTDFQCEEVASVFMVSFF